MWIVNVSHYFSSLSCLHSRCKNKIWRQRINGIICPILCCVSITVIVIDIVLQCKAQVRKLPDALRFLLLPHLLLYYILIALKPIDLDMMDYYSPACTFVGFARHFFYLSIVSWTAALSYSTCSPFFSLKALTKESNKPPLGFSDPRFKWYLLFSLGLPCSISPLTILRISYDDTTSLVRSCGLSRKNDYMMYLLSVM